MYQGMSRDWLAACFAGSLCLFFGALWLYKDMILMSFIIQLVFLPGWTAGEIYLSYNRAYGNAFTTWWYAAVCVFQFFVGFATLYLYAWTKAELEARAREEEIKVCQKKMTFARDPASITAYPCMHRLWNKDMETVMKRYDNMHQIDVRANILCPICKDRIDFIHQ